MNRREAIQAAIATIVAGADAMASADYLSAEDIAALERVTAKLNAGLADSLFEVTVGNGGYTNGHVTVNVTLEWIDPDLLYLRSRGFFDG